MSIQAEEWRPVVGYEGLYEVSSLGRVKSLARRLIKSNGVPCSVCERILRFSYNGYGYSQVALCLGPGFAPVKRDVHVLVAAAFIGPRPLGYQVLHGPNGHTDNSLSNLSYGTLSDNYGRDKLRDGTLPRGTAHGMAKIDETQVREIRARLAAGEKQDVLAAAFGVSQPLISLIKTRRAWAWLDAEAA